MDQMITTDYTDINKTQEEEEEERKEGKIWYLNELKSEQI